VDGMFWYLGDLLFGVIVIESMLDDGYLFIACEGWSL